MWSLLRRNAEFWNHERSLTALLVYLSLSLFLSLPLADSKWLGFLAQDLLFIMIALSGVFAVATRAHRQFVLVIMAVVATVIRVVYFVTESQALVVAGDLMTIVFYGMLTRLVLFHIFKDGPVNFYRIEGSIVVYILAGLVWALLYHLVEISNPGSFFPPDAGRHYEQLVYFSFITLTTLGFGDIMPLHPVAKALAVFQGMFGMLYPVLMVARLVAMEVELKKSNRPKPE